MLTADTAKNLLNGKTEVSLDLGLTTAKVNRTKNGVGKSYKKWCRA